MEKDDLNLWQRVIETVTSYRQSSVKTDVSPKKPAQPKPRSSKGVVTHQANASKNADSGVEAMDRKTLEGVRSGKIKISGKIDLHGLTKQDAYDTLLNYISLSKNRNKRWILVITGKGSGALQGAVPKWLSTPAFSSSIRYFEKASKSHGGDGALYVCLKR